MICVLKVIFQNYITKYLFFKNNYNLSESFIISLASFFCHQRALRRDYHTTRSRTNISHLDYVRNSVHLRRRLAAQFLRTAA